MKTILTNGSTRATRKRKSRPGHTPWAISKHELAMAYAPNLTTGSALNRLSLWMNFSKPLMKALKKTGYNDRQRNFSKCQLSLIYRYLGMPNLKNNDT